MLFSTDMFYVIFNAHVDIAQPAVYTKKSLELGFFGYEWPVKVSFSSYRGLNFC